MMQGLSEKDLIALCRKKDRRAQTFLYEKFKSTLMGTCIRYSSSLEEAEDIFQEGFIRIFESLAKNQEILVLEAWLRTVMIRTAIRYFHKHKKFRGHLEIEYNESANADFEEIIGKIQTDDLMQLVNSLPEGYRLVFNLHVVDSYKHAEIAELLGISESTSKTQLLKAKAQLKHWLKKREEHKYEKYF